MHVREPLLEPVPIKSLRPTQITVGMREVFEKRQRWRTFKEKKKAAFLGRHMVPVIWGPKGQHYVIDHHHLTRALQDEGQKEVLVSVVADLRSLKRDAFWVVLDHRGWCHPYDTTGRRRDFDDIPRGIAELEDDPFRSLAGELRRAGGFAKDTTPFSEFLWADFLRRRMKRKWVQKDFAAAMTEALELAKGDAAHYLPGWCGPAPSVEQPSL
ncbi:MAG TPA: ParB-like protein [Planctomycetota bacterium]|nr:ParB-like protein [Planctomycetota bacterium]